MTALHKNNNYSIFTSGDNQISIRRVFHPVRGEETQLEIFLTRHAKTRRHVITASFSLTPEQSAEFAKPLIGNPTPLRSSGLMQDLNAYTPRQYDTLDEPTRKLVIDAFNAGREYEASLK